MINIYSQKNPCYSLDRRTVHVQGSSQTTKAAVCDELEDIKKSLVLKGNQHED